MKKISSLFKFFSLKPVTVFALAVAAILALVLSACAPIPESERLPPLQPGYGRIIVNTGGVGSRAVTDADKKDARLDVSFNGVSYGHTLHATFKVGTDVRIVVKAYRNDASNEFIGYGTASHTMTYGTNQVTVDIYKVDGYYKVTYEYGDALLGGTYRGITTDKNYYKGGEDEVSAPSDDDVMWQHGTLSGWKYNDGSGDQIVGASDSWTFPMPSADTTLTAQWTRNRYEIIYDMNSADSGGTPSTPAINTDTDIDALTSPQISATVPNPVTVGSTGYTFTGWLGSDGKTYQPEQTVAQITGNLTLKAQWTDKTVHTVTYNVGTGPQQNDVQDWKPSDTYIEGSATGITLPKLSAKGYTFTGWQDGAGMPVQIPYKPTQAVTLTAQWTANTYKVKFSAGTGSGSIADMTFTYDTPQNLTAVGSSMTKTGYSFNNWSGSNGQTYNDSESVSNLTATNNGEVTLTAQWSPITYNINLHNENSNWRGVAGQISGQATVTATYDRAATLTAITPPSGYTFAGWTKTDGTTTSASDITQSGGSYTVTNLANTQGTTVDLYPVWQIINYKIVYNGNSNTGGTKPADETYTVENNNVQLAGVGSLVKTGYSFLGWNTTQSATSALTLTFAQLQNHQDLQNTNANNKTLTLYAVWQGQTYTITYSTGSGNVPQTSAVTNWKDSDTYTVGTSSAITLPTLTATGYTFGGWQINGATQRGGTTYTPTQSVSATAQWTPKTYTITYSVGTGNVPQKSAVTNWKASDTYTVGTTAITLPTLSATGYTFNGWQITGESGNKTGSYTPTQSVTATAQWTPAQYTVTYSVGTGNVPQTSAVTNWKDSDTYTVGTSSAITLPTLTATGYTFGGWQINGVTQRGGTTYRPTASVTVTALWTPITYTIKYYDVDANSANTKFSGTHGNSYPQQHVYGTDTTLVTPTATKKGFSFDGWYTDNSGNAPAGNSLEATAYTNEIKLYAKWNLAAIDMVTVTGDNTFMLGEAGGSTNAEWGPVQVSTFKIGKYEVTQAQWQAVMGNKGNGTAPSSTYGAGDNFPMYYVNWFDAVIFCNELSKKEGKTPCYYYGTNTSSTDYSNWKDGQIPDSDSHDNYSDWNDNIKCNWNADGYRLPTEAEWEYAARGGINHSTYTYSGSDSVGDVAWYLTNSSYTAYEVGTKAANALGIFDMSGNVSEWCWDWYDSNGYASANGSNTDNPTGATSGSTRLYRGGSRSHSTNNCRVVYRNWNNPYDRSSTVGGFRIVCRP